MPISHTHRYVFIHVSKTGGTSIKTAFLNAGILKQDREHLCGRIPEIEEAIYKVRWWQHLRAWQIRQLITPAQWDDYFKFAFVRNPWERVVSEYFYVRKASTDKPSSNHYGKIYPDNFLEWFDQRTPLVQSEFLCDPASGEVLVDFVGRFENLAQDFKAICDRLDVQNLKLPHELRTKHGAYRQYYDDEAKAKVEQVCAVDIENFRYKF